MTTTAPPAHQVGDFARLDRYVVDLRDAAPDLFIDAGKTDWKRLTWRGVKRPYRVERWAEEKRAWEVEHGRALPVHEGWTRFNRHFHELFMTDVTVARAEARRQAVRELLRGDVAGAWETLVELIQLGVWNKVHRVEDAVWDPRGKRALFEGLGLSRPRILFLGAADGYEAMQLAAMYPGGHVTLVDYDDFCRTDRFGKFPERYPFLGADPATGGRRVWYREEMPIDFEVADIRDLSYGAEFDVVVSVGLVEHFPDEHKGEAFAWHRKFLKPGGWAILTTPRDQWRGRAFYSIMADWMNYGYRELMTVRQLGLYAWENGFDVVRAGVIKAHNGIVCRPR
ncbi:MAG TPA: methyltransferase domain-containing protein [Gemmatimonadales bacterium]|nr:methyltransferase domain-containing protein [Gemmatimonadales bacterium]